MRGFGPDAAYVKCSCDFVFFPYGVQGQVWYLIVSIPDFSRLPCFTKCYCVVEQSMVAQLVQC